MRGAQQAIQSAPTYLSTETPVFGWISRLTQRTRLLSAAFRAINSIPLAQAISLLIL